MDNKLREIVPMRRYIYIEMSNEQFERQREMVVNLDKLGIRFCNADIEKAMSDTIKRLTQENTAKDQVIQHERDGNKVLDSLLRQKEEENKRLQSLIRPPSLRD